ncbi:centrosomal protein of 68 kDa [Paramisgurnus dabryanus]|uniref:centrosomal protein of 68 kDa n=1 Tax=Paramisgurnus dabryanus TaxID=90735 RepID=UPI0031F342C6
MGLGVDMALSDTSSPMENRRYGRWRSRIPEFIHSGHSKPLVHRASDESRPACAQEVKDSYREQSGCKKTVTMAPVSRYMTDKSLYIMRKPLISATQSQMPILKNSPTFDDSNKEPHIILKADSPQEKEKCSVKQSVKSIKDDSYTFSQPMSSEDLDTSMNISDLRLWSCDEEPILNTLSNESSLSSSPTAILSLTVPQVPKLTSTPLRSSHSPIRTSCYTKSVKTRVSEMDKGKDTFLNKGSSQYYNKNYTHVPKHMSPYQANYWACAIPNSMPPSPDRSSPSWDPDKEYQALLDYTYPLRPNMANTWSSPESLLRTEPLLQDSGIELDHIHSSSSLSCLDQSQTRTRPERYSPPRGQSLTGVHKRKLSYSKSSDDILSSSLYSSLDQTGLSGENLDCDRKHYRKFGVFSTFRSDPTFIRSTHILARPGSREEWDEEFLRLPEQIKELNLLSQQLRDISAQISKPVTSSWESLGSEVTSVRSPTVQVDKRELVVEKSGDEDLLKDEDDSQEPGARIQEISREVNRRNLREVKTIMNQLSGMSMSELQRTICVDQVEEEPEESLMQHIVVFCSNLEKLIRWLYKVVEKVEVLSPPTVDLDSVKASLADYKSFQEDVHAHKPLTTDVLQTGEMLLHCMSSASPFLKETLALIERQSHTLETHSEYLFSSIISAMDSLTDPRTPEREFLDD